MYIYIKHKSKCPYDVEETNKPETLRHKKKLELSRELRCLEQSTMIVKKHEAMRVNVLLL